MHWHTQKQIIIAIALIAGMVLAAPAAAIEGQNSIHLAPINPSFLEYQQNAGQGTLTVSEDEGMHPCGLIPPPPRSLSHSGRRVAAPYAGDPPGIL